MNDDVDQVLDSMLKVTMSILEEWHERKIIQPFEHPKGQFTCTDCGACCSFEKQFSWIYPSDLQSWSSQVKQDEFVHLLFGTTFEILDNEDMKGLALPSQRAIAELFPQFLENPFVQEEFKQVCKTILIVLKKINPNFDDASDYCIFYDPKASKHCLIYEYRPLQCRAYPFDASCFVTIQVPQDLRQKYPMREDRDALPFCPSNAFSNDPKEGVVISEQDLASVSLEKANHFSSIQTQDLVQNLEIQMSLIVKHHLDILKLDKNARFQK